MKEIFLIRHGVTIYNEEAKYLGRTDVPLSPAGLAQAHLVGQRLMSKGIETIYTSPLIRAKKTAEIIAEYTSAPVEVLTDLQEIDFGCFEGKTYREIKSEFGKIIDLWLENPHEVEIPEGEAVSEIRSRVLRLKEFISNVKGKVALVGHGGILKLLLFEILSMEPHFWEITISNGSLTHLVFLSSNPSVVKLNDTSHFERSSFQLKDELCSPLILPDGTEKQARIEIRKDPLTGHSSHLCHYPLPEQRPPVIEEKFASSRKDCPFCPENIGTKTPSFHQSISEEKIMRRGEAVLFPNISPYDEVSGLIVVTEEHFVDLGSLSFYQLKSAFTLASDFLKSFPDKYPLIAWNFLPPSGGSLVHPHIQVIASKNPGNFYRQIIDESRRYLAKNFVPYWKEFLEKELDDGKRVVYQGKRMILLSAYAPRGGAGEWIAIFPEKYTLNDLDNEDWEEFIFSLLRLFSYFRHRKLWSFNLGFFFSRGVEDGLYAQARIIPRYQINPSTEAPDATFYTYVYEEPIVQVVPEREVQIARRFFDEKLI